MFLPFLYLFDRFFVVARQAVERDEVLALSGSYSATELYDKSTHERNIRM